MTTTVANLLRPARNWTQFEPARTKNGFATYSTNPNAVCWCLLGAVRSVYGSSPEAEEVIHKLADALSMEMGQIGFEDREETCFSRAAAAVIWWNDYPGRTHAEVVRLCKEMEV